MRIGKPAKKSRVSNKDSALNWILEIIWIKLHVALLFTLFFVICRHCKIFSFAFPNQIIILGRFCRLFFWIHCLDWIIRAIEMYLNSSRWTVYVIRGKGGGNIGGNCSHFLELHTLSLHKSKSINTNP